MASEPSGVESHRGPRPGDIIVRRPRVRRQRLRRVLGIPSLYGIGYGNVGSSIYYALGITAVAALGATPLALAIAGLFFVFTALTYAEGTAMLREAGGAAAFARQAFNELTSFIAGWALMLSYVVTISVAALTVAPYLGYFYEPLKTNPAWTTSVALAIVVCIAALNFIGVRETGFVSVSAALFDLTVQVTLVLLGLVLLFDVGLIVRHVTDFWPDTQSLAYGVSIAMVAYIGLESVSQVAEETRIPERRVPRAMLLVVGTVIAMYAGVSLAALSAMTPTELATTWASAPVAGIAASIPVHWLRNVLQPLVAVLAAIILTIAANAGLIGASRLAYSMSLHDDIPTFLGRLHGRFRTPYVAVLLFAVASVLVLLPGYWSPLIFQNMGALYGFGAMLAFSLAHASIIVLRWRRPDIPRPFKPWGSARIAGRELPLTAVLGLLATAAVWGIVVVSQPYSRWVGLAWIALGLVLYAAYRWRRHLPLVATRQPV